MSYFDLIYPATAILFPLKEYLTHFILESDLFTALFFEKLTNFSNFAYFSLTLYNLT